MKKFKFNKPLVTSEYAPDTTQDVLWVTVNNSGNVSDIKELNRATGSWTSWTLPLQ